MPRQAGNGHQAAPRVVVHGGTLGSVAACPFCGRVHVVELGPAVCRIDGHGFVAVADTGEAWLVTS